MTTFDQMLVDNQYTSDYNNNPYSYDEQTKTQDGNATYGQTDYPQTTSYGNKEDESMYRYASSRLTAQSSHSTSKASSVQAGATKSPYDIQSTNNHHSHASETTPKNEARQDSLFDPLLTELDSLSNPHQQKSTSSHAPSIHSQNSMSYQSQVNHGQHQQQYPHAVNMGSTDIYIPSSNPADPELYFDQYDRDHQLHQQNDSSPGLPSFRQQNTNPFINPTGETFEPSLSNDDELFQTNHHNNSRQKVSTNNQDQKRQAMWNKLQQTNGKFQDKNVKKRELPARGKATVGSNTTSTTYTGQQSSRATQSPQRLSHRPIDSDLPNYIEKNIGMIKNKENYFHRISTQKYQTLYTKRKGLHGGNDDEHSQNFSPQTTLPLTINLNTGNQGQFGTIPTIVEIPIDGDINHMNENLSVDINLRVLDEQNSQQQQHQQQQLTDHSSSERTNRTTTDALDRHIRKMERSINQNLPATHSPQRSSVAMTTSASSFTGSLGTRATGLSYSGYNSLNQTRDTYNFTDRSQEENSYLAQMHHSRRSKEFKPYTTRDYDRFKKNCGFGTGHLGFDSENTTYREKVEKANKVKEYAQQIEARNKKIISEVTSRTSSETRSPTEDSKTSRQFENTHLSKRPLRFPSKSTHSSPVSMTEIVPFVPARRPVDVSYRTPPIHRTHEVIHQAPSSRRQVELYSQPPSARRSVAVATRSPKTRRLVEVISTASSSGSKQRIRLPQHEQYELVETVDRYDERDVTPVNRSINNPPKKRREQNDENDSQHRSIIESPSSHRTSVRRLSPAKIASPTSRISSDNGSHRRPLRFETFVPADEVTHIVRERTHSIQAHKRKSSTDQNEHIELADDSLMKVIRDELTERPLQEGEELVVIE
ncbi:hypothetical protein I4U23_012589 [Adineta vaga]|nr:hypothetical protein I4U23_012589 [Adineta vaga]